MKHSCREVTALVLKSQDQPLGWTQRLRIRSHLMFCGACTRFAAQMRFMQDSLASWRQRQ